MELNEFIIKEGTKPKYILDTSVIVKWYFTENEDDFDVAMLFYEQVSNSRIIIISPELMIYEQLNFFISRHVLPQDKISRILSEVYDILFIINSSKHISEEACRIAGIIKKPIYDCIFIALSSKLQYPLFTADSKLCDAAKKSGYDVFNISQYKQFF